MIHPYVIMLDSDTVHNLNPNQFPQSSCLFGLVFQISMGNCKTRKTNLSSSFHLERSTLVNCTNKRNLTGMFNVPSTNSKLCNRDYRVPCHSNEPSVDMLGELIELFSTLCEHVLDSYAGTMNIAIDPLRTGRNCFAVEKNADCFNAAPNGLRAFLPSQNSDSAPCSTVQILEDNKKDCEINLLLHFGIETNSKDEETKI